MVGGEDSTWEKGNDTTTVIIDGPGFTSIVSKTGSVSKVMLPVIKIVKEKAQPTNNNNHKNPQKPPNHQGLSMPSSKMRHTESEDFDSFCDRLYVPLTTSLDQFNCIWLSRSSTPLVF